MKNIEQWKPTKFEVVNNHLQPSSIVSNTSYRMASYISLFYNENIAKYASGNLLDLGCGTVPMYGYYKQYVKSNTCADWGNCEHETSHVDVFCDLNLALPFEKNSFDTIIFSDVLEHLSEPKFTLQEINRILKPSGVLIMNYPFLYGLHEVPYDYCRYTKYRIRTWIDEIGMKIIKENEYGGLFDLFERSILRMFKNIKGGKKVSNFLSFFFKKFHKSKISNNTSHPYMYGYIIKNSKEL
jgi:SAM-dependent methyltransferase